MIGTQTSLSIEVMYSRYLSKRVICFSFGAFDRVYDIENAFLVCSYTRVLLASVPEPSLAKEVLSLVKANANVNLESLIYWHLLGKYDVDHPVFNLRCREILVLLRPRLRSYFYFVETLEILGLTIGAQYLVHAEPGELNVLLWYEANCVVGLLVGNIA